MKIFNRDFFVGMGAGIVVTLFLLLLFVFYYMFAWWLPGGMYYPERMILLGEKHWKVGWKRHLIHQPFLPIMIGLFNLSTAKISKWLM